MNHFTDRDPVSDRLLTVGCELFARHGYAGTSVREITRRAQANLGAITYHFGSKRAFYQAVISSEAEPLVARVAQVVAAPGAPLARLEAIIRAFFDHIISHPEMPKLILRELAAERPLPPPARRAMEHNLGAIVGSVKDGQRDGSVRPGDPVLLALSAMAQPFHFVVAGRKILEAAGIDLKEPATRARVVDHVVTTVRRALAA
jgi:AcrR family transcriptional regulator